LQSWQQITSLLGRAAILVAAAALVAPASASGWAWPVQGPVLRVFDFGSDPYASGLHRGVDVGAASGEAVVAPAAGTISFAGSVPGGGER
jgi:septal ring factor EnvC (AmiA/AmiB activator)